MRNLVFVVLFVVLSALMAGQTLWMTERLDRLVERFALEGRKKDKWFFELNNKVKTLEEQRDIERRVMDIEEQLRVYCTGTRIEMCGKMKPIQRRK